MNSRQIARYSMVLVVCVQANLGLAGTNTAVAIRTKFVATAVLSSNDVNTVVGLANSCGMKQVAQVETFYYLPSRHRGIQVTSVERVDGRKVEFETLAVYREGWCWKGKPTGSGQTASWGPYWVEGFGLLQFHVLTTFPTVKGRVRVAVGDGISTELADKIIHAFTSGEIQYEDEIVKGQMRFVDLSRPGSLNTAAKEGHYAISFTDNHNRYIFTVDGGSVKIVQVIYIVI